MIAHIYNQYKQKALNEALKQACAKNDLELVKYLLTSKELKRHAKLSYEAYWPFRVSITSKANDVAKYLLTQFQVDIHAENDDAFRWSCKLDNLEMVKFLTTSPEIQDHANIHAYNEEGFRWACQMGNMEVIKFLLSLENKPNIYIHSSDANQITGFDAAVRNQQDKVIDYFIYDLAYQVQKTPNGKKELDKNYQGYWGEYKENVLTKIQKRDLLFRLEKEFEKPTKKSVKVKI